MYNIEPEFIINMDEISLNYNMPPNTTSHKVGEKIIFIKTQLQVQSRVSVILSFCGNGEKLPPYIIFKDDKNGVFIKNY